MKDRGFGEMLADMQMKMNKMSSNEQNHYVTSILAECPRVQVASKKPDDETIIVLTIWLLIFGRWPRLVAS